MIKYTKEELLKMDAVDVYKMVLSGNIIKKFPDGFWQQSEAKDNAARCTRYLIEDVLKYDDDTLKQKSNNSLFIKNKLSGMLQTCFNASSYQVINNAYPGKFKEWEFKQTPQGYWTKENGIKATKWLIEEKLCLNDEDLKKQLSSKLFKYNGLGGMLEICFGNSPYEAINSAYPNKFKEWEFNKTPMNYWTKENGIKAMKWLIDEKLKFDDNQIKEQFSVKLIKDNKLSGMLEYGFKNNIYEAINSAYPNKFKEWELNSVPNGYWDDKKKGIEATKWLIEEKLNLNDNGIRKIISYDIFKENGLNGMLRYCFNDSPYNAVNATYPNKFKEWELNNTPSGYWTKENGIKATKWLIEEKLKLSKEELKQQLSKKLFMDNGLRGMLSICFNDSPYEAINSTYPNEFKEWEFKVVKMGFWRDLKNGISATRWLIEEKLALTDDELKNELSVKFFKKHGLGGMLEHCFKNSPYNAINATYPNKFKKDDFKGYQRKKY